MAFMKLSYARVTLPSIELVDWFRVARKTVPGFQNRVANKIIHGYDPKDYLFTHCTIIASVDTEDVANVKTGTIEENGLKINRKFSDYYITPDTAIYVNGNGDSWERQTLLNTYRTFVGAYNYEEHVQIPSESKGKIIDAVARDLGDTVYVDILVATARKHTDLINRILTGKMKTLSMGCEIQWSLCSKCGNLAADETELCPCVKYSKGTTFVDEKGTERIVAELCGHKSDPASVKFIEASWVADPAFVGAVVHSILNPNILDNAKVSSLLKDAFEQQRAEAATTGLAKAAKLVKKAAPEDEEDTADEPADEDEPVDEDADAEDYEADTYGEGGSMFDLPGDLGGDTAGDPSEDSEFGFEMDNGGMDEEDPDSDISSYGDLIDNMKTRVFKDVYDAIVEDFEDREPESFDQLTLLEDSTLLEAKKKISKRVKTGFNHYKKFGWKSLNRRFNGFEMLLIAKKAGVNFSFDEIKTLMKVGSVAQQPNVKTFLKKCQYLFNKPLGNREIKRFVLGGYLLNLC